MDDYREPYITTQAMNYAPTGLDQCGIIRLQIRSEKGKTNWLNVSPDAVMEIEMILRREYDERGAA